MTHRIEIISIIEDTRALVRKKKIEKLSDFSGKIHNVAIVDVYTIDKVLDKKQLKKIADALTNPISQQTIIISEKNKNISHLPKNFSHAFEIGFLPGVTDNIAATAKEIIEDLLRLKFTGEENVYTSQITFIEGKIDEKDIKTISGQFFNPLIQRVHIKTIAEFKKDQGMDIIVPKVHLAHKPKVIEVDLNITDQELEQIGKMGILDPDGTRRGPIALSLLYMKAIQSYFQKINRNPTDIELETLGQTWSEHCKHTIFANRIDEIETGLYNTYIKASTEKIREKKSAKGRSSYGRDFCVSVFKDNSGAIEFDENYLITDKVETHNSPSALDPFGGAITGIVGVNRDTIGFGLAAKPIINTYGYCFGLPDDQTALYRNQDLSQKMLVPRRIMDGVVDGVNVGGNCSGIPTPQGFVYFDKHFSGKPLVFCGTLGLIPKYINNKPSHIKKAENEDLIVMIGGRVGADGIHGVTFASVALDSGSPATAVQIGDPITQKKFSDALVKEARKLNLYNSITDNGGGGLSSSVLEMAKESGGCEVNLEKIPLKYPGLDPWEIWISESQERMTLAIPNTKWKKFYGLMKRRGVEATIIGKFTNSGKAIITYKNKTIMDMEMDFLHNGLPKEHLKSSITESQYEEPALNIPNDFTENFLKMIGRLNICGFEFISSQYDHEVQGTSVIKPLTGRGKINNETTVVKPLLNSDRGIILSQGIIPSYSNIDTYHMAACSIDTAIRNAVVAGANLNKLALLDNFCWCSSNEPERLEQLKKATKACYDYAVSYETPFISGKDSMFNDFKGFDANGKPIKISIPPTLLISSVGLIDDVKKTVTIDAKFAEDLVYVLGETDDELGGSEYYAIHNQTGKSVPQVNAQRNKKLYQAYLDCLEKGLIVSGISITRGGLAVALAKTAIAGKLGIDINLNKLAGSITRNDFALFSESQGRIIVTINPKNKNKFERVIQGNSFSLIGKIIDRDSIQIKGLHGEIIVKTTVTETFKKYKERFKDY